MPPGRQDWVDAAKGVAIVLVVIGHSWRGLDARGLVPPELFTAIDQRIYAFHMPVFFALSGLFFASALERGAPAAFIASRLSRLIWPMVLWLYLFLAVKVIAGARANTPAGWSDLLIWPIPGQLHLWFLWALFVLHMTFLATRPLIRDGRYPLWALTVCLMIAIALPIAGGDGGHWLRDAVDHAPFFILGLILGQWRGFSHAGSATRIGAALLFVAIIWAWSPEARWVRIAGSLTLTFCVLVVVSGIGQDANSPATRWLAALGAASMAIYLVHTIFSAALREALLALGYRDLLLHLVPSVAVGLIGPLIVLAVARRFGVARALGF